MHAMSTLVLRIDEHWPQPASCDWVLRAGPTTVLQAGHSEPGHWPAAETVIVLLAGSQVVLHRLAVPKGPRRERRRLVAYALEEAMPADPEDEHLTVGEAAGGALLVAAMARARLHTLLATLAALGRPPTQVMAVLGALAAEADTWELALESSGAYLRRSDGAGAFFDHDATAGLPWFLRHALLEAQQGGAVPRQVRVRRAVDAPAVDLEAWRQELPPMAGEGTALVAGPPFAWWAVPGPFNLRHGEFAAPGRHRALLRRLRPALAMLAAAGGLQLAATSFAVFAGRAEERALRGQAVALFQASFPGAAVVDPALQMRRQLNDLRSRHGLLRDDDFLALLGPVAEVLGAAAEGAVRSLGYAEGTLEVTLMPPSGLSLPGFAEQLALHGVVATSAGAAGAGLWSLQLRRRSS